MKVESELIFLRREVEAYKKLAEGLAMKAPGVIGKANTELEEIQRERNEADFLPTNVHQQQLEYVRKQLLNVVKDIDKVLFE